MSPLIEIFYDLPSTWTRLAYANFHPWLSERPVEARWRPFLIGGVFNAVNYRVYAGRENPNNPKFRLTYVWLKGCANLAGVAMNFPSPHHPVKSVKAMRFCCALEVDPTALLALNDAAFEAYFAERRNLGDIDEQIRIADSCRLDGTALAVEAQQDRIKERLRANTQEAFEWEAFGSPTFFFDEKFMYFEMDQLTLVRRRREASLATEGQSS